MTKRVTLADVAAHAGVSRATASLVVREAGTLTPQTRERVKASMDALGYVYHRGAASLRGSRTQSVGVIVPDISNGFTAEMTIAVESILASAGRVTLMGNSLEDIQHQDILLNSMLERQVDGLLVVPAVGTPRGFAERLSRSNVPTVIATRALGDGDIPYVGIDNVKGGQLAAEHLLFHGAKRVAYLGGFANLKPRRDRIRGVRQALRRSGVALEIDIPGAPRGAAGREITLDLLARDALPDAIVCHNDLLAFGVYRALRQRAPHLLESVHVISFDDVAAASLWEPPLTTVAASGKEVGISCAQALLARINDPTAPVKHTLISSNLVIRESCGCRAGAPGELREDVSA